METFQRLPAAGPCSAGLVLAAVGVGVSGGSAVPGPEVCAQGWFLFSRQVPLVTQSQPGLGWKGLESSPSSSPLGQGPLPLSLAALPVLSRPGTSFRLGLGLMGHSFCLPLHAGAATLLTAETGDSSDKHGDSCQALFGFVSFLSPAQKPGKERRSRGFGCWPVC